MRKKFKKAISLVFAIVLVLLLSSTALAAKENVNIGAIYVDIDAPSAGATLPAPSVRGALEITGYAWWANGSQKVDNSSKAVPGNTYTIAIDVYSTERNYTNDVDVRLNGKDTGLKATVSAADKKLATVYLDYPMVIGTISSVSASVKAPAVGQKPSFDKIAGTGYYSDNGGNSPSVYKNGIRWYDNTAKKNLVYGTNAVFEDGHSYTATIVLVADTGYEFASSVSGASERVGDDSVIVYQNFELKHTHSESSYKTDKDNHWTECTSCGNIMSAKAAHKDANNDGKCDVCAYAVPVTATSSAVKENKEEVKNSETQSAEPQKEEVIENKEEITVGATTGTGTENKEEQGLVLDVTFEDSKGIGTGVIILILIPAIIWLAVWVIGITAIVKNIVSKKKGE